MLGTIGKDSGSNRGIVSGIVHLSATFGSTSIFSMWGSVATHGSIRIDRTRARKRSENRSFGTSGSVIVP